MNPLLTSANSKFDTARVAFQCAKHLLQIALPEPTGSGEDFFLLIILKPGIKRQQ
jgi:hypothetical protein